MENMKIVYEDDNFRKYEPKIVKHNGKLIKMILCEEFEGGRWEGFYSIREVKEDVKK